MQWINGRQGWQKLLLATAVVAVLAALVVIINRPKSTSEQFVGRCVIESGSDLGAVATVDCSNPDRTGKVVADVSASGKCPSALDRTISLRAEPDRKLCIESP